MPHLYAAREEDGYYGLGYALAEDRLDQILLLYVAARGDLAKTFGAGPVVASKLAPGLAGDIPDAVDSDLEVRRWQVLESARETYKRMPVQQRRNLAAYMDGIRRYLADHPERRPAWAPELEPALPLAVFTQLIAEPQQICASRLAPASEPIGAKGSDAWVIGRSRTKDGGVIFSSDTHGPWTALGSTLLYPWRMKAGGLDLQAYESTGTAFPLFGNSRHFAWGWTEAPRYPGDCYRVKTKAGDPLSYDFDGKTLRMAQVPYRIAVKGAAPVVGTFDYTRHNGVLSPVMERRGEDAYVVSYAYQERVGAGSVEMDAIARARGKVELKQALQAMDLYPANLVLGGADGTLFYIRGGRTPKRAPGLDLTKPMDGNTSATAWTGRVSYDEALKLENPVQDYIVNNNTSPDMMYPEPMFRPQDYPAYMAFDVGHITSRQKRSMELLSAARNVDDQGGIDIALDEKVPGFDKWAAVFRGLERDGGLTRADPGFAPFLDGLEKFDGVMGRDSTPALYFDAFWDALSAALGSDLYATARAVLDTKSLSPFQAKAVARAAIAAHAKLLADFGRIDLTLGDVHRVGRGQEDYGVGGGGFNIGGDRLHLDMTGARVPGPEIVSAMRAMAFQSDPKDPRRKQAFCCQRVPFVVAFHPDGTLTSHSVFLPGISDDPASPHYDDQMRLVGQKVMHDNDFELTDLLRDAQSSLVLTRKGR
jgi:acyl-homoserine-lactone acylase